MNWSATGSDVQWVKPASGEGHSSQWSTQAYGSSAAAPDSATRATREKLMMQQLETNAIQDSLGEVIKWWIQHDYYDIYDRIVEAQWSGQWLFPANACPCTSILPFFIGSDLKQERQIFHINFFSQWFLFNAVRAIESGSVVQLNGCVIFRFCHAAIDMIVLGFCSMGGDWATTN